MVILGRDFNALFLWDKDWQIRESIIKKDPYRFIKSHREEKRCWRRFERFIFIGGFLGLFSYKHFRYHNELSRVKAMKFTGMAIYSWIPRIAMLSLVLYPFSLVFFKDTIGLKSHQIAKIELQKFDREYFKYDEYGYVIHNAPLFKDEDSVWGRLYMNRLLTDYYQTAGWIKRRRESNPSIESDVPPRYDNTPKGPRKSNFKEIENMRLHWFKNSY
jgi:hypothetical protein